MSIRLFCGKHLVCPPPPSVHHRFDFMFNVLSRAIVRAAKIANFAFIDMQSAPSNDSVRSQFCPKRKKRENKNCFIDKSISFFICRKIELHNPFAANRFHKLLKVEKYIQMINNKNLLIRFRVIRIPHASIPIQWEGCLTQPDFHFYNFSPLKLSML